MTLELYYNFKWTLVKSQHLYCAKLTREQGGNIIPIDPYKCLCPQSSYNSIENNNNIITAFGGHIIPHYGTCELILSHHGHSKSYTFHGVNTIGLQSWASQPVVIGSLSPLTMVWQPQRPEESQNSNIKAEMLAVVGTQP